MDPSEVMAVVGSADILNGLKRGKEGGVEVLGMCGGSVYSSSDSSLESSDSGVDTLGGNGHSVLRDCWAVLLLLVLGFCVSK